MIPWLIQIQTQSDYGLEGEKLWQIKWSFS
jgi:hypothetical protein